MTTHDINLLIERYLDGETTPAEERQLALAVQRRDRPAEWAIIAEMLGELTTDEAIFEKTHSQPLPERRGEVAAPIMSLSDAEGAAPLHSERVWRRASWAAAACVALAVGLFVHYTHHDVPQDVAHVKRSALPQVAKQAAPLPAEAPQAATAAEVSHAASAAPQHPAPASPEASPLLECSLDVPDAISDTIPDARLYLALQAEVEARVFQAEQSEQQLYQALLDELLVNIEQQSNRPELSL